MQWIVAGAHALDSPLRVSAGRLARHLAGRPGNRVLYLASPFDPWDLACSPWKPRVRERLGLWPRPRRHGPTLWEHAPLSLALGPAGTRRGARLAPASALRATLPPLTGLLRRSGFLAPDVLLVSHLRYAALDRIARPRLLVYRAVDDIRGFEHAPAGLALAELELLRRATLCIASSSVLAEELGRRGARNVHVVRHGADPPAAAPPGPGPPELERIPRPRIVYVGALNERLNVSWIEAAARALPETQFVFIGPQETRPPAPLGNLHLLGERTGAEVGRFLARADAAMIPFVRSPLVEATCPIKLYEYLAAGLPVVATRTLELTRIRAPVRLVDDVEGFVAALAEAPGQPGCEGRRDFAREHSWSAGFEAIEGLVGAALDGGTA